MSTYYKSFVLAISLLFFAIPSTSFALLGDVSQTPSVCFHLKNNFGYGYNDAKTGGEVTKLQEFLKSEGFLKGNTSGFFGVNTRSAVRAFQKLVVDDINENDIDSSIITSQADRQSLASTGFRLSTTGNVAKYTRAKIALVSCDENTGDTGTDPIASSNNPSFNYSIPTAESPLYVNFVIDKTTTVCTTAHGYAINFGDGEQGVVYPNTLLTTNSSSIVANGGQSCAGYFATHAYKQPGTYSVSLTKLVYNTCQQTPGMACPAWYSKQQEVATLTVNLTSTSAQVPGSKPGAIVLNSPTCTIPVGDSQCYAKISWNVTGLVSGKTEMVISGGFNYTIAKDTYPETDFWNGKGESVSTYVLKNNGTVLDTRTVTSKCAVGSRWNGSICAADPTTNPGLCPDGSVKRTVSTSFGPVFTIGPATPDTGCGPIPVSNNTGYINIQTNNCTIQAGKSTCPTTTYITAPTGKLYSLVNVTRGITTSNATLPSTYASGMYAVTVSTALSGDSASYMTFGTNTFQIKEGDSIIGTSVATASCVAGSAWNGGTCVAISSSQSTNVCTSWTYGQYGACQSNGTKIRTATSPLPAGCTGGTPLVSAACTYVQPTCQGNQPTGPGVKLGYYTEVSFGGVGSSAPASANTVWAYGAGSCGWTCTFPMVQNGSLGCKNPAPGTGVVTKVTKSDNGSLSGVSITPNNIVAAYVIYANSPVVTNANGVAEEFWFQTGVSSSEWTTTGFDGVGMSGYKIRSATGCTPDVRIHGGKQVNYCTNGKNGTNISIVLTPGDISTTPVTSWSKSSYQVGELLNGTITGGDPNDTWACMESPNTKPGYECSSGRSDVWRKLGGAGDDWKIVSTDKGDSIVLTPMSTAGYPAGKYTGYVKTGQYGAMGAAYSFTLTPAAVSSVTSPVPQVLGDFIANTTPAKVSQGSLPLSTLQPIVLGEFASNMFCVDIGDNLHRGMESSSVTQLQNFLLQKGMLLEQVTGFYGDKTVEAVKKYQVSKGLPETGMVYDFTRSEIRKETCK